MTAINLVVAPTAGVEITGYNYLDYYVNIVYTAPSSCSLTQSQTLTTAVPIYVPYEAQAILQPESIITSMITYEYITDQYTRIMGMLDPTDIPSSIYASASSVYAPAMVAIIVAAAAVAVLVITRAVLSSLGISVVLPSQAGTAVLMGAITPEAYCHGGWGWQSSSPGSACS